MTTTTATTPGVSREQISALSMSTLAFAVNFAVWVMFSVIGIKIKAELNLNETEFGLLVATPILTGSLVRLPLGILTDRYGGRIVYFLQMLTVVIPTWNGARHLPVCFSALRRQTLSPFEVILVDNASADETRELVARDYPETPQGRAARAILEGRAQSGEVMQPSSQP